MKFTPAVCHRRNCQANITGTEDTVPGLARVFRFEDGEYDWTGTTDICWDAQESIKDPTDPHKILVQCTNGHQFYARLEP